MLSNFDIEEIANHYNLDVQIIMKDELKNMKPINTNYIINLESSTMGNGTHWMALKIQYKNCVYCDSYCMLPPEEIISFCKRIQKSHLSYNTKEIQDINAQTCGFFAMAFLIFLNYNNNNNMYQKSSSFSNIFSANTKLNNKILQQFYLHLPTHSSNLQILNKLYRQK